MKIIKEKEDECVHVCFFETLTTRETIKPKETFLVGTMLRRQKRVQFFALMYVVAGRFTRQRFFEKVFI